MRKIPRTNFLDGVDERNVSEEIWRGVNKLYSTIIHLVNYKYNLLIYRLVRKGYVKNKDLMDATGYSKARIYQIVSDFEQKEVERMNQ